MSERLSIQTVGNRRSTIVPIVPEVHYPLFNLHPQQRSQADFKQITRIIESCPFFTKEILDILKRNQVFNTLLNTFKYEKIPAKRAIYHEGAPADKFYVVLKGAVKLFTPRRQKLVKNDIETQKRIAELNKAEPASSASSNMRSPKASMQNSPLLIASSPKKLSNNSGKSGFYSGNKSELGSPEGFKRHGTKKALWFNKTEDSDDEDQVEEASKEPESASKISKITTRRHGIVVFGADGAAKSLKVSTFSNREKNQAEVDPRINQEIHVDDQLILLALAKQNKKYVVNGICHFVANKLVSEGECFGEIHRKASSRVETAYATSETHLLSLKIEEYLNIFEEPVRERRERIALFKKLLGQDFQEHLILQFANKFQRCLFEGKEKIYKEGKSADGIYLITEGELELLKTEIRDTEETPHRLAGKVSKQFEVAKLFPYQFFGCEELLGLEKREYTAEVSSLTMAALKLESVHIKEPLNFMKPFLKFIVKSANMQREWEKTRLSDLKEGKKLNEEIKEHVKESSQKDLSSIKAYYNGDKTFRIPLSALLETTHSPSASKNPLISQSDHDLSSLERANKKNFSEFTTPVSKNLFEKHDSPASLPKSQTLTEPRLFTRPFSAVIRPEMRSFLNRSQQTVKQAISSLQKQSNTKGTNQSAETGFASGRNEPLNTDRLARTSLWKMNQMKNLPKMRNNLSKRRHNYTSRELIDLYDSLDGLHNYQNDHSQATSAVEHHHRKKNSQSKERLQESVKEKSPERFDRIEAGGYINSPILHDDEQNNQTVLQDSRKNYISKNSSERKSRPNSKTSQVKFTNKLCLQLAKKKLKPFLAGMANASECSSALRKNEESILEYIDRKMPSKRHQDLSAHRDQSTETQTQFAVLEITDFKGTEKDLLPSGVRLIDNEIIKRKLMTASSNRSETSRHYLVSSRQHQFQVTPSTEQVPSKLRGMMMSPKRFNREINLSSTTALGSVQDAFVPFSPILQRSLVIKSRGNKQFY